MNAREWIQLFRLRPAWASPARPSRIGYASIVCYAARHAPAIWVVRDRGVVWVCPDCQRERESQALRPHARGRR